MWLCEALLTAQCCFEQNAKIILITITVNMLMFSRCILTMFTIIVMLCWHENIC